MIKLIPYILSLLGFLLSFGIYKFELNTIYSSTLAPFFQIIGKPIRTMNKALTKMIPVDSLDEKEYGDAGNNTGIDDLAADFNRIDRLGTEENP